MSLQLARYLKDFSPSRQPALLRESAFATTTTPMTESVFAQSEPEPQVDVDAERAEAYAAGRAEAEAELERRHRSEIGALCEQHAEEMAALRTRCELRAAALIAERFAQMADDTADLVAGQAANVLAPVLDEALARKAVADLAAMIRAGLPAGEGFVVTVKGPSHLFEQLRSHFKGETPAFRHVEADDLDIAAEFGETVLVTRMAAWADTVRKVLA